MRKSLGLFGVLACLGLVVACGEDGSNGNGNSNSASDSISGDGDGDGDGDSNGDGDGDSNGDGDGDGDGDSGDGDGDGDGDSGGDGGEVKWDVTAVPDGNLGCGAGGNGGDTDFSYIWIANSSEGTMTKLNTETLVEEGRFQMRPDGGGSPSRTSVNLSGDVAISARSSGGGVSKFWADINDCVESNGQQGIQTSTGKFDVLAWDQEECRAWHQPFNGKNYYSNRPMAWAPGVLNEGTCQYEDEKLWTSGSTSGVNTEVLLLDGETGEIDETIVVQVMGSSGYLYGGAVDGYGNFWGLQNSQRIIRIDREDFTEEYWQIPSGPGYGIAVDSENRIWTCGGGHASRFDPETEQWQSTPGASSGIGGCMTDGDGTLYHSRYNQGVIVAIDTETVTPVHEYTIPNYVHGISIDFNGYVWGVRFSNNDAYRLDPETEQYETYSGLNYAYTYSDMTGFGLSSVVTPNG